MHELGFKLIKQPLYKKAINYSATLIMNIPESKDFFLKFLNGEIKSKFETKCVMLNLGYDPDEYFLFGCTRRVFNGFKLL